MSGEKEFRRWIVTNAGKEWMMQTIETSTGTGVPDLFMCVDGYQLWAELKSTSLTHCYMRISQWRWFCKLCARGGFGLLIIKREKKKRVDVYSARQLVKYDASTECILRGQDIIFPATVQPAFSYKLGTGNGMFYKQVLEYLEKEY